MKQDWTVIRGSKGGKGGGGSTHVPTEAPDSLRSRQSARLLDLISEGEIEGLVTGDARSIYLDDVPVQNEDGTYNFSGLTYNLVTGTQAQGYMPGFSEVESEQAVSLEVKNTTSITKTITNTNIDAVRVTIGVPQLTYQNPKNGDLTGTSVTLAIDVQNNGGGFVQKRIDTISGKTTSRYQRSYRVALDGSGPWDVRVRRITADSTEATRINRIYWESYTEIIDQKLKYPNSAIVGLEVDSAQFNRIPVRGYDMKLLKVKYPSNYNPVTREYSGAWDGTFTYGWTDNPAWIFYDLVTQERYGLGAYVDASLADKWGLYEIAQYCDELVSDGFGGLEPRYTCNVYIQKREQALKVLQSIASVFRGMAWWGASGVSVSADKPETATALFTAANVVDGFFDYPGSDIATRHTVALVTWNDPDLRYRQAIEYVPDEEGIALYGIREIPLHAVGCTSRGQAHRMGRWLLFTERMETETVVFRSGFDGLNIYPGQVINVLDPDRAGVRHAGRLLGATSSQVTVDDTVTLQASETYTLYVTLPDGSLETKTVTNAAGDHDVLNLDSALSDTPQKYSVWMLSSVSLEPETWRIVSVIETESHQAEIVGAWYDVNKFAAIEQNLILGPRNTSQISLEVGACTNLNAVTGFYESAPGILSKQVLFSWETPAGASHFIVTVQHPDGTVKEIPTMNSSIDIAPAADGYWLFQVTAFNLLERHGPTVSLSKDLKWIYPLPSAPTGLTISAMGGLAVLRFDQSPDTQVIHGGTVVFRHQDVTTGAVWQSSTSIGEAIPGNSTVAVLPLKAGTYLVKFVDNQGYASTAFAFVTTKQATSLAYSNVGVLQAHPVFAGTHSGTEVVDGVLRLTGADTIDEWTDVDSIPDFDTGESGVSLSGEYFFQTGIDLGSVKRVRLTTDIEVTNVAVYDLIDNREALIDDWEDFDGISAAAGDLTVWVRETDDDPTGTPTWSEWQRLDSAEYEAWGLEFKAVLTTNDAAYNINASKLAINYDEVV